MNKFLFTTTALIASSNVAIAQELIDQVNISGNKRLQTELIESYLPFTAGMTYSYGIEQKIIKTLYSTGQFSDVLVKWDNSTGSLNIEVKENPQVNRVAFEDNEELDDSVLKKVITIKSRSVFTNAKVQEDISAIKKAYVTKGYYLVEVYPEYIKQSQNRIDVIYKINEASVNTHHGRRSKVYTSGFGSRCG